MKFNTNWAIAGGLIATAVVWRVINWHYGIAPNLEIVTASTLVAATFLTRRLAFVVPLAIMAGSDLIIGNSPILIFTWSAFAIIALGGILLKPLKRSPKKLLLVAVAAGAGASVFFFLYTNFGVWLIGDGTMYAKTWSGLMQCYVMGLPFYRTMILGNLAIVPAYFAAALYAPALVSRLSGHSGKLPASSQIGR